MLHVRVTQISNEDYINNSFELERNKEIVKRRINGLPVKLIAAKENLSNERVRQIIKDTTKKFIDDPLAEYKSAGVLIDEHKKELIDIL